jgi:hypothetical protein
MQKIDGMIAELESAGLKPEYVVMGRNYCADWLKEMSRQGDFQMTPGARKYRFTYRNIPVVVCESGILEVVPNAKEML